MAIETYNSSREIKFHSTHISEMDVRSEKSLYFCVVENLHKKIFRHHFNKSRESKSVGIGSLIKIKEYIGII